ncbi:MAG: hypothetical protein AB8H79_07905, partial [Myxococcota bacterium]
MNPSLRDGRVVFASHDGGCHVYEPLDVPPPGGQHGASEPVHCPHIMLDPVWAHCAGGSTLYIERAGGWCSWRVSGNPRPPGGGPPWPGTDGTS